MESGFTVTREQSHHPRLVLQKSWLATIETACKGQPVRGTGSKDYPLWQKCSRCEHSARVAAGGTRRAGNVQTGIGGAAARGGTAHRTSRSSSFTGNSSGLPFRNATLRTRICFLGFAEEVQGRSTGRPDASLPQLPLNRGGLRPASGTDRHAGFTGERRRTRQRMTGGLLPTGGHNQPASGNPKGPWPDPKILGRCRSLVRLKH